MNEGCARWILRVSLACVAGTGIGCRASVVPPPAVPMGVAMAYGVMADEQDGVLPGVTITAVSTTTGESRQTTTDVQGLYYLKLPPGAVRLTAAFPGFKSMETTLSVSLGRSVEWSPSLELAAMTETVTVTGGRTRTRPTTGRNAQPLHKAQPAAPMPASPPPAFHTESYAYRKDSDFREVAVAPLSTFSVDVDRASYANVRRFLNTGQLPPIDAVRIEEMLNYFPYDYAPPADGRPFAAHVETAPAPWKPEHRLVRIGLKAREITRAARPASNLVFLIDVSGSMTPENKLPLVQQAFRLLVEQLDERDRIAIVVYAGAAGMVLGPTTGDRKEEIQGAIDRLQAGGSTAGGAGIQLAYDLAVRNVVPGGVNRVILATDGDFNVGVSDQGSLVRLVQEKAKAGIFLTVLGFGMGNYKDSMLEALADHGDGNYAYIDTLPEARKALVEELTSTLVTVAKDVKVQVEWNPSHVRAYRLIGYENRLLNDEDFKDDAKDAGEVGAGHQVTVLYEVVPPGIASPASSVDPLVFSKAREATAAADSSELLRLKLRYKAAEGGASHPLEWPVQHVRASVEESSADFQFASAVAAFGMLLRGSPHRGAATPEMVTRLAKRGKGADRHGYRAEFLSLVAKAQPQLVRNAAASGR